jgi:hypothetical protein
LFDSTKDDIRKAPKDKTRLYEEEIFWHRLHTVKHACRDLHNYVARSGIFFPPLLKEQFTKISNELWSAVGSKAIGHEAKDYQVGADAWKKIEADITPLYKAIESEIHARLRSHGRSKQEV